MILELVEADKLDDFDADDDHVLLLDAEQRSTLIRMAITTAYLLQDASWRHLDWINQYLRGETSRALKVEKPPTGGFATTRGQRAT